MKRRSLMPLLQLVIATWLVSSAGVTAMTDELSMSIKKQPMLQLKTCYEDILPLQTSVPSLTAEIKPLMVTNAIVNVGENTVWHLRCEGTERHRSSHGWPIPHRGNHIKLLPENAATLKQLQGMCGSNNSGISVAIGRVQPLSHFGHRMLADLPALYALKTFLQEHGVGVSEMRVFFLDDLGPPAWGTANFKPILESLGYKSFHAIPDPNTPTCFQQVILMPVTFYPKWFTVAGRPVNMWQAPEVLYDTDPFHLRMVGDIRAAFGLPQQLPFVNASTPHILVASRNASMRKKAGFRMGRLLTNEMDLFKSLSALPKVTVEQVDLGTIPMQNVVRLLDKTSLFIGYHGAAFDNLIFLPRGAYILEILPSGTAHSPLYPSLATRTSKEFTRYVNNNVSRQTGRRKQQGETLVAENCQDHHADLKVNINEVVELVKSILHTQQAAMTRYSFDNNV